MALFDGTPLQRPVTCPRCALPMPDCKCPRDGAGNILLPNQQTAKVQTENRGKGRLVTTIKGLDPHATNLPDLVKQLKQTCAAGGALQNNVIEIQGDHRPQITATLKSAGYKVASS